MILSRRHGFVFIKARKVGGTSVETALSLICKDDDDIITPITPVDERVRLRMGGRPRNFADNRAAEAAFIEAIKTASDDELPKIEPSSSRFNNHMTMRKVARHLDIGGLMKIGIVRSPYGIMVSSANHSVGFSQYRKTGNRMVSSADEIRATIDRMIAQGKLQQKLLSTVYKNASGQVDIHALRQEHLQDDFAKLLDMLGIADKIELPRAKEGLGLSSAEAFELLRPDQRTAIAEAFADDIRNFGDGLA